MRPFRVRIAPALVLILLAGCGGEDRLSGTATGNISIPTPPRLAGESPKDLVMTLKNAKPKVTAPAGKLGGPPRPQ